MTKKRVRSKDSEDENKENRILKRLKKAERKFRKQQKRYRRAQQRRDRERDVTSDESDGEECPASTLSNYGLEDRQVLPSDSQMSKLPDTATQGGLTADTVTLTAQDTAIASLTVMDSQAPPSEDIPNSENVTAKRTIVQQGDSEQISWLQSISTYTAIQDLTTWSTPIDSENGPVPAENLDPKILELMGKRLALDRIPAPDIHKDLVVKWQEVLQKGLPVDGRKRILEKYPPPANCTAIDPLKLNVEVKASLLEAIIKKDARVIARQERVAACLAALGKLLSFLLKANCIEKLMLVENLSDIARLLVDVQHDDSLIRRSLILSNLNTSLKDTLNSTVVDEWLFGKNLEEQLKSAKLLERSTKDLISENLQKVASSSSKNFKGPPRRLPYKKQPGTQGGHNHSASQRQTYQSNNRRPSRGLGREYSQQRFQKKWP